MGTLTVTYNGKSTPYTMEVAPAVTYGGGIIGGLTASGWSGEKTLKCSGKRMKSDVKIGSLTLKANGKRVKTDIKLKYTANPTVYVSDPIKDGGTFTIPSPYNRAQFFIVGGGGASQCTNTGGYKEWDEDTDGDGTDDTTEHEGPYIHITSGGGGGYVTITPEITITPGASYTAFIGAGGTCAKGTTTVTQGGTSFVTIGGKTYSAKGGYSATLKGTTLFVEGYQTNMTYGGAGGSGGGAAGHKLEKRTGDTTKYYYFAQGGSNGGNGEDASYQDYCAGGKGQGTTTICSWSGTDVYYAGGGGGGANVWNRDKEKNYYNGGKGGGGHGNSYGISPTAGSANTGGGGGGLETEGYTTKAGMNGGSGVIIAKYWEA